MNITAKIHVSFFFFKFNFYFTHHILDLSWVYLIPWLLCIRIGEGRQVFVKLCTVLKPYKAIVSLALTSNSLNFNFLLAKRLMYTQ